MLSELSLRRKYLRFNRKWFNDTLPKNTEVWFETTTMLGLINCDGSTVNFDDTCDTYMIRINPIVAWSHRLIDGTLLHEMAHIAVGFGTNHGKPFQDEMKRLASINAFKNIW